MKFILVIILSFSTACSDRKVQTFSGILQSSEGLPTVTLPISGKKVCIGGVSWRVISSKGAGTNTPAILKFGKNVSMLYGNGSLKLSGGNFDGAPTSVSRDGHTTGQQWKWSKDGKNDIPKTLWGWGLDSTLNALIDPKITHHFSEVTGTEVFADCGAILKLRAVRNGDTLEWVKKKK